MDGADDTLRIQSRKAADLTEGGDGPEGEDAERSNPVHDAAVTARSCIVRRKAYK